MRILRSEEGRQLRARHQANVHYLLAALFKTGLRVVEATPSSLIIPVLVGNPALFYALSDVLLQLCDSGFRNSI